MDMTRQLSMSSVLVLSLAMFGCTPEDEAVIVEFTDVGSGSDTDRTSDASQRSDGGTRDTDVPDAVDPVDLADQPPQDVGLKIEFDWRFDRANFLDSAEARGVLAEAARQWGVWLRDDFDTIVAGTPIYTKDPEDPGAEGPFINIENDIDDVLVFVGSAPRDGSLAGSSATAAFPAESDDPVLRAQLMERWESAEDFEPWTAWISFDDDRDWYFDPTPQTDDVPAGSVDALSVTLHELGHILGISPGAAFAAHVVNGTFQGPHAMEVYGGPVPLDEDGYGHIATGVTIDGKVPVMSTRKPSDVRYEITRLDRAILADIGYELP